MREDRGDLILAFTVAVFTVAMVGLIAWMTVLTF